MEAQDTQDVLHMLKTANNSKMCGTFTMCEELL